MTGPSFVLQVLVPNLVSGSPGTHFCQRVKADWVDIGAAVLLQETHDGTVVQGAPACEHKIRKWPHETHGLVLPFKWAGCCLVIVGKLHCMVQFCSGCGCPALRCQAEENTKEIKLFNYLFLGHCVSATEQLWLLKKKCFKHKNIMPKNYLWKVVACKKVVP